jgi:hypothetical protein
MIKKAGTIHIYDDFLTDVQAEEIIKTTEEIDNSKLKMGYISAKVGKGHEGGNIRSNMTFNLTEHAFTDPSSREYREAVKADLDDYYLKCKQIQDLISKKLQEYVGLYCEEYEIPIHFDEGFTILRYQGGQEYKSHCDYAPHIPRYLSALILLNPQDYEGGGTYFEYFDENIKPDKPSLVLFPSNYAYAHRAMPVIKGTKYAIVTWLGHVLDWDGMPVMYTPQGGQK